MRPHRLDWLSLVFGLLFVLIAIAALADALLLSITDLRWVVPSVFVALGAALVISSIRRERPASEDEVDEPADGDEPAYVAAPTRNSDTPMDDATDPEVVDESDAR